MPNKAKEFMVEDARIIFRNFEGKEGMYNAKGERNFAVVLDPDSAKVLEDDGWNVKYLKPREDDEMPEETPYIQVKVSYDNRPPRVTMITSGGRTLLNEDTIETLDYADLAQVDLVCRGFDWEVNGKSGTKAYLKTMFATLEEDELEKKYAIAEEERG